MTRGLSAENSSTTGNQMSAYTSWCILQFPCWFLKRVRPGVPGIHRPISAIISDPDHDVRFASVVALGNMGDVRAIGPLCEACQDENGFVRTIALEMVDKLKARQST